MSELQLFPALDAATEAALRESIRKFGVIVPIVKDQHGRIIDGHHRARIADELGADYRVDQITVIDDEEAREVARTLNAIRRHLSPEQRREIVAQLRGDGHSLRAIAGAVGVDEKTVRKDVGRIADRSAIPVRVQRRGGGTYPAQRPSPVVTPSGESPAVREARLAFERRLDTVGVGTDEGQRLLEDETAGLPTPEHLAEVAANREAAYDANFPGWREQEASSAAADAWNRAMVRLSTVTVMDPAEYVPHLDAIGLRSFGATLELTSRWIAKGREALDAATRLHAVGGKA